MNNDCLSQMRNIYAQFTGYEIADAIKVIRAELTLEEQRTDLQREILKKQAELELLKK